MKAIVPFDKPSLWSELKRRFFQQRHVQALIEWQAKRRIRKYEIALRLNRRHFLLGVVLAPFTPIPRDPAEIKQLIASEFLKTAEGRQQLAMTMIEQIRRRIDYAGFARRVFVVEQLPEGASPIYYNPPKDDESV